MSMKRMAAIISAVLLLCGAAQADETYDGTVVAGETISVTAPFGGTVKTTSVRQGQYLSVGDTVAVLGTTRVLATEDGTVRGIDAAAGDSASGTVLYLSPVSKYTLTCNLKKAYESADTLYVRIGERVYIQCVKDGSHMAEGIITAVNGSQYTVLTTAGELYMQESVYIYRGADFDTTTRIGTGTVSRTPEIAVSGTGSILRMAVTEGEEVERGQLLFETVEGSFDALIPAADGKILSDGAGVVSQVNVSAGQRVNQGDTLLTLYARDSYQIAFTIPEDMLTHVAVGQSVRIYFNWNEDKSSPYLGTVTSVSYLSDEAADAASTEVTYTGYASFTPDATVYLGMNVIVTTD